MSNDFGTSVHYLAVKRGTPVYDSEGEPVGKVRQVKDNFAEHILDGIEIDGSDGEARFIDAPEVARTFENGVTLTITAAELPERSESVAEVAAKLPAPARGGGFLGRIFGRS